MRKSVAFIILVIITSGCATKSSLEKHGFLAEHFLLYSDLGQAPNNPSIILDMRPLSSGTNSAGYAGARAGADLGSTAVTIGGGDPVSIAVGLGAGIIGAGVGAVTGMFSDVAAKKAGQNRSDLYEVLPMSTYFLDPKSPMSSPEIAKYKCYGNAPRYLVRFDRKDVKYAEPDIIVLKETDEKIAGRRIYRAIDIFDAKPGDTNSKQFLARMQNIAKQHGTNKRIAMQETASSN